MLDKGFWFFLQFPYNLSIVFLLSWLYAQTNQRVFPVLLIGVSALVSAFWMEGIPSIFFWLPSGASTVIVATIFTLIYFSLHSESQRTTLKIPKDVSWDRSILKQELTSVENYDDRQRVYLDFVKKLNGFLSKINNKMGHWVNYYFIVLLALIFCINFGYWFFSYTTGDLQISQLFDKSRIEKLVPDPKMHTELLAFYGKHGGKLLSYSASLTMILNTLSLFLILPIIRWTNSRRNVKSFFWLDLCFFRLPESTIFVYIPIIALFIVSLFYDILTDYAYWFSNLAFMFSFLYLLNGFAIARAYTKARFLPFGPILIIMFVSSWFAPQIFVLFIFSLFSVGLLDFAFNIKKKALQHVSVRIQE